MNVRSIVGHQANYFVSSSCQKRVLLGAGGVSSVREDWARAVWSSVGSRAGAAGAAEEPLPPGFRGDEPRSGFTAQGSLRPSSTVCRRSPTIMRQNCEFNGIWWLCFVLSYEKCWEPRGIGKVGGLIIAVHPYYKHKTKRRNDGDVDYDENGDGFKSSNLPMLVTKLLM